VSEDIARRILALERRMAHLEALEGAGFLSSIWTGRLSALNVMRGMRDDFWGDLISPVWAAAVVGTGVFAALQTDSPSRVLLDTGGTTGGVSVLNEGGFLHWAFADKMTIVARIRLNSAAAIDARIGLEQSATDMVFVGCDAAVSANFLLRTRAAGVNTNAPTTTPIDTNWHIVSLSIASSLVKARIDGGDEVQSITNIPAGNSQLVVRIENQANASKTLQVDYILAIPDVAAF